MNGLKEHRNVLAQEKTDERFKAIEAKLDAILQALANSAVSTEKKVTTGPSGEVISTQTVTTEAAKVAKK